MATQGTNFLGVMRSTVMLAAGLPLVVLAMLAMIVLPMPPLVLDALFTFNICISLVVILAVVYVMRPLDLAAFPTVLLLATLLRLALNVASTRVVLLHGHTGTDSAGKVIEAFGEFVIGGNYAVGIVVFAILVIVNFVVVTKGAGRVSEVSARFTLDSMPGKQMAIDADLNAGIITQQEAVARRAEVRMEADFYGSMDGASKFVRGDAVAGLLILFINLIGGMLIGVLQHDMDVGQAARDLRPAHHRRRPRGPDPLAAARGGGRRDRDPHVPLRGHGQAAVLPIAGRQACAARGGGPPRPAGHRAGHAQRGLPADGRRVRRRRVADGAAPGGGSHGHRQHGRAGRGGQGGQPGPVLDRRARDGRDRARRGLPADPAGGPPAGWRADAADQGRAQAPFRRAGLPRVARADPRRPGPARERLPDLRHGLRRRHGRSAARPGAGHQPGPHRATDQRRADEGPGLWPRGRVDRARAAGRGPGPGLHRRGRAHGHRHPPVEGAPRARPRDLWPPGSPGTAGPPGQAGPEADRGAGAQDRFPVRGGPGAPGTAPGTDSRHQHARHLPGPCRARPGPPRTPTHSPARSGWPWGAPSSSGPAPAATNCPSSPWTRAWNRSCKKPSREARKRLESSPRWPKGSRPSWRRRPTVRKLPASRRSCWWRQRSVPGWRGSCGLQCPRCGYWPTTKFRTASACG